MFLSNTLWKILDAIFLPNWKNLCLYLPQNLSSSCVERNNEKKRSVWGKVTHSSSRWKGQKAAARASPERNVHVFCLFGELSEGTWNS